MSSAEQTPGTHSRLKPKLEAVLIRLCRGRSLNKTQAVKLPYLVDVVAMHDLGHQITESTHQTWDHGVVASEAWHYFDRCEVVAGLRLEPVPWSEKENRVVAEIEEPSGLLATEEQSIVDFVKAHYASKTARELGKLTKFMNPKASKWGSNQLADLGQEAYDRMSPSYRRMVARIESITLDELIRTSRPVLNLEDLLA